MSRMHLSRRGLITLGVMGGSFLAAIEATIVATAMPTIVTQLGGLSHYSWVFSGYLLASTVTVPLWGKLSDLYGRRRFYMAAVAFFLAGSALSGAARSMTELIVFRAIQGFGAGGLLPLGMTILGEIYTLKERARTQALISMVWGVASIVGPLAGGYITDVFSWRWIFYLNIPFGVAAAALVGSAFVDAERHGTARVDYRGALAMMASITLLMLALGQTGSSDAVLSAPAVIGLYGAAILLGGLFVRIERRSREAILPLDMLSDRLVASATISGFLVGVAMFGALSYVPLFVQAVLGGSAREAGHALSPLLIGWVVMSVVTGRILPRVGFRPCILTGLALVTLGFAGLLRIGHGSSPVEMYVDLGLMGLGMGTTMLALLLALQQAVPRQRLGVATSLGQFTRSIGGAVGVSMMGAVIAASLPPGGEHDPRLMELAIHRAFVFGAVVAGLALVSALWIPRGLPVTPPPPPPPPDLPANKPPD